MIRIHNKMSRTKSENKSDLKANKPALKSGSKNKRKEKNANQVDSADEQASEEDATEEEQTELSEEELDNEEANASSADEEKQPLSARKKRRRTQSLADEEDAKLSQAEQLQALTINPNPNSSILPDPKNLFESQSQRERLLNVHMMDEISGDRENLTPKSSR
jgi:hypothetical protein